MGKGSGGGTNTVTNNSSPPPEVMEQYRNLVNQGNQIAGQPLNQYGGPMVAGFTGDQNNAFQTVRDAQGLSAPYLGNAQQMIQDSQKPLWDSTQQWSPQAIQQYMNPYQQDVVNSTMANLNETDAQQNQQVVGNAISKGAWGGDRAGIAQAELARQQGLANGQTLAGLNASNYNQANTQFNTQQAAQLGANTTNNWLASQGAYGEANLGTTAQSNALQGAAAQLATGQQQQTLAQSALNIPYEQFQQQQAYPYQNLSWLSSLSTGLGSGMGGTSSSTQPSPNGTSQALGTLGSLGQLGYLGYLAFSDRRLKDNIKRIGDYKDYPLYEFRYKGDNVKNVGVMAQDVEKTNPDAVREAGGYKMVDYSKLASGGVARPRGFAGGFAAGGDIPSLDLSYIPNSVNLTRGSGIPNAPQIQKAQQSDDSSKAVGMISQLAKLRDMDKTDPSNPLGLSSGSNFSAGDINKLAGDFSANGGGFAPGEFMGGFARGGFADGGMTEDDAQKMLDLYGDSPAQPAQLSSDSPQPAGLAPALSSDGRGFAPPSPKFDSGAGAAPINKPDALMSLFSGLAAMGANTTPYFSVGAAHGADVGMKNYQDQKDQAAKESYQQGSLKQQGEKLYDDANEWRSKMYEESAHNKASEGIQQQTLDETSKYHNRELDLKARQKWTIDPNTGMPMNVYTGEIKNPYEGGAAPTAKDGSPSQIPDEYFGELKPSEIMNYRNTVKKNQPKDLQNQQAALASLVDQKQKVDDLANQIPIASSGDYHKLTDFIDRNQVPILSDPARANATILQNYDAIGNVLDNIKSTFGGTGRVLQAEFSALQNELGTAKNASPEQKAAVIGKIQQKVNQLMKDQYQYTQDVQSGMAYMPARVYQSPMQKRLGTLVEKQEQKDSGATDTGQPEILSAPPAKEVRVIGKTYATPKGNLTWTADGWIPAGGQ